MRRLRQKDSRQIFAEGSGHVLARRLPQMRLLRLQVGRSRFNFVHQRQLDIVQKRLFEVSRAHFIKSFNMPLILSNNSLGLGIKT